MELPFTQAEFLSVFTRYNETVWPAQVLLYLLALAAVMLALKRSPSANRTVSVILGILWLWMGAVYHLFFFVPINPLARIFGAAFVAQGALFLLLATRRADVRFTPRNRTSAIVGGFLIAVSVVIYPALAIASGHVYPAQPTFGLPCPTTIFTLGLLTWGADTIPKTTLVVPALWSIVGTSAAIQLGITEDLLLIAAFFAFSGAVTVGRINIRRYSHA